MLNSNKTLGCAYLRFSLLFILLKYLKNGAGEHCFGFSISSSTTKGTLIKTTFTNLISSSDEFHVSFFNVIKHSQFGNLPLPTHHYYWIFLACFQYAFFNISCNIHISKPPSFLKSDFILLDIFLSQTICY